MKLNKENSTVELLAARVLPGFITDSESIDRVRG
jgi:hypothetical protein